MGFELKKKKTRGRTKRHVVQLIVSVVFTLLFGFIFINVLRGQVNITGVTPLPGKPPGNEGLGTFKPSPAETADAAGAGVPSSSVLPVGSSAAPNTDVGATPDVSPETPPPSPSPTPVPYHFIGGSGEPIYDYEFGMPVPETPIVYDEYFSDTAIIGNSLIQGFKFFSGLTTADIFGEKSISVNNIETAADPSGSTIFELLSQKQYGKIYILLGINEIAMTPLDFKEKYLLVIDLIKEAEPDAEIYIQAITPVTRSAAANKGAVFTIDRVRLMNEMIAEVAEEKELFYVDIYDALSDDEGYLPEDASTDGVHLISDYYMIWCQYLRAHTINRYSVGTEPII